MVQKRKLYDVGHDDFGGSAQESKRRLTFNSVTRELLHIGLLSKLGPDLLEPLVRKVVREEVERVVLPLPPNPSSRNNSLNEARTSGGGDLQLYFSKALPKCTFTGNIIRGEDGSPFQVVLCDASSRAIVQCGPLSSARVDIFVINGELGSKNQDDWTSKEFSDSIIRERDGREQLISGTRTVTLKSGVGWINDVVFTDNSRWLRCGRFRLGARIRQQSSSELRIREAISEPIKVKDHRGEGYQKHHPPLLEDEIWRLEGIAKDGQPHMRLASRNIKTVKDFLHWYQTDPTSLRSIFGRMSNRKWEKIVKHATTCIRDNKLALLSNLQADPFSGQSLNSQQFDLSVTYQDQPFTHVSTSYNYEAEERVEFPYKRDNNHSVHVATPTIEDDFIMGTSNFGPFNGGTSWFTSGFADHVGPSNHSAADDSFRMPNLVPVTAPWDQGNDLLFQPTIPPFHCCSVNILKNGKRKGWFKIWAAVKCSISVRRDAAAKRARYETTIMNGMPLFSRF